MLDIRRVITGPKIHYLSGAIVGSGSTLSLGTLTVNQKLNTMEEKVEFLMKKVDDLEKMDINNKNRIKEIQREMSTEIDKINSVLGREIVNIKNDLKDKATVDYCLLVSGSLLTAIGMLITNLPDDYYYYFCIFVKMT